MSQSRMRLAINCHKSVPLACGAAYSVCTKPCEDELKHQHVCLAHKCVHRDAGALLGPSTRSQQKILRCRGTVPGCYAGLAGFLRATPLWTLTHWSSACPVLAGCLKTPLLVATAKKGSAMTAALAWNIRTRLRSAVCCLAMLHCPVDLLFYTAFYRYIGEGGGGGGGGGRYRLKGNPISECGCHVIMLIHDRLLMSQLQ